MQSMPSLPPLIMFTGYVFALSSLLHRCFPSGFFPSSFPTKTPCMLLCPVCVACSAHLIIVLITQILFWAEYRSSSSLVCSFLQSPFTSSLLGPNISSAPCFQSQASIVPPLMRDMKSRTHRNWRQIYSYVYFNLYVFGELMGVQKLLI